MVSQVVVRKFTTDAPIFEALGNGGSDPPLSFEDSARGVQVPRLGSEDLLRIADYAMSAGYYVDGFLVLGRHGSPLTDEQLEVVSDGLANDLTAGPEYASAKFSREYPGHYVAGVNLTSPEMHILRLRRLGVVETDAPSLVPEFFRSAWKRVHFS